MLRDLKPEGLKICEEVSMCYIDIDDYMADLEQANSGGEKSECECQEKSDHGDSEGGNGEDKIVAQLLWGRAAAFVDDLYC